MTTAACELAVQGTQFMGFWAVNVPAETRRGCVEKRDVDAGHTWAFREALGDYAADVVELLLADGFAVGMGSVTGPRNAADDSSADAGDVDGHVVLVFPKDVAARFGGAGELNGLALEWGGLSGWRLAATDVFGTTDRWLGAGLTPTPTTVANFVVTASLDFGGAGSEDRPFYRAPGSDLDGLLYRVMSAHAAGSFGPWEERVREGRLQACWDHATRSVLADTEATATVTVSAGELRALEHLVDLTVDVEGVHEHLRHFARLLVQDWKARAAEPAGHADVRLAREYAAQNTP
ncbi:hypothetical protein AB0A71_24305 [Kitasatospora aureofaciens]|uniref:hypothetical protein n=1 Tax=Kitasatospora aureofaciens TaxID=1894 RepID=UPI0033E2E073